MNEEIVDELDELWRFVHSKFGSYSVKRTICIILKNKNEIFPEFSAIN